MEQSSGSTLLLLVPGSILIIGSDFRQFSYSISMNNNSIQFILSPLEQQDNQYDTSN